MIINNRDNDEFLELARQDMIPLGLGINNSLDINLRFKRASFNIILGHANVGKTYWILWYQLALSYLHGLKHLIYSAENSVNSLKRNLIELYLNKKITKMSKEELESAKLFIEEHFTFIDMQKLWTIDEFMQQVQTMPKFDSLMIDPINSFQRAKFVNAHESDYETATKLRLFAKKTGTTIYVAMHASTEALRKVHPSKHEYEGLPQRPNGSDAEGGGKWINRCDDFITIHRYTQSPTDWMYTQIHVLKVKESESGGKPTFLNEPVTFKLHGGTSFLCGGINSLESNNLTNLAPNKNF